MSKRLGFYFILFFVSYAISEDVCRFNLNDRLPKSPLILTTGDRPQLLRPIKYNVIEIPSSKIVRLSCPNSNFNIARHRSFIDVKCIKDDIVETLHTIEPNYLTGKISISKLECEYKVIPQVIRNGSCSDEYELLEVGYRILDNFVKIFNICFDSRTQSALYSYYDSWLHLGNEKKIRRTSFENYDLAKYSVEKVFAKQNVHNVFGSVLGFSDVGAYFRNDLLSIVPLQLTPKDDLMFGPEQRSTFVNVNIVPQWNVLRDGIWAKLENEVRNLLRKRDGEFQVATGVYDVWHLKDKKNKLKRMFMFKNAKILPIPKYIWKIIYNRKENFGIAAITMNDPFIQEIKPTDLLCENICEKVEWLKSDVISGGLLYCCEMNEFLDVVGYDNMFV